MWLTPIYRFTIDSPMGIEAAWQKLVRVTALKSRLFNFSERKVSQHSEEDLQYVGYLERYHFRLYRPNARFVKMLRLPEYTNVVIKGKMETGGSGCKISVTIRPPFYQMFFLLFSVLLWVFFLLCLIYSVKGVKAWMGLGVYTIAVLGLIGGKVEGFVRERVSLEHIFGVVSDQDLEVLEFLAGEDRDDTDEAYEYDDDEDLTDEERRNLDEISSSQKPKSASK